MLLILMLCWVTIVISEVHEGEAFAETRTSFLCVFNVLLRLDVYCTVLKNLCYNEFMLIKWINVPRLKRREALYEVR